jgi:hypothetical protein
VLLVNCNEAKRNNEELTEKLGPWDYISISLDKKRITILNSEDSSTIFEWQEKELKIENGVQYGPYNKKEIKFVLNKNERDSIYKLADCIMRKPVYHERSVTCYAGDFLRVCIHSKETKICREYSKSIGSWKAFTNDTRALHSLLNSKIKLD